MWKLTEIKIRNIVSFHEASLVVTQGVATLIFGKNEDNASQPCNGSGKSSLIEAISFALTGEQLRKVKSVEEIINDLAEEAYVYVRLDNDFDGTSFTIERAISRNAPQSIECHKYNAIGEEIELDKTIQPTVSDYNKFILGEIGLSKDDIYNNFILCDNKYEGFFDCSDRSKKEIINRFSNGVIVDESIARLQKDMLPVEANLEDANREVVRIQGSISAIQSELAHVDERKEGAQIERQKRLERLDSQIVACREEYETAKSKKVKAQKRLVVLSDIKKEISKMDESDMSLIEAYQNITKICADNELESVSDFVTLSEQYKQSLERHKLELAADKVRLEELAANAEKCRQKYEEFAENYKRTEEQTENDNEQDLKLIEDINKEIADIDKRLDKIEESLKANKAAQSGLEVKMVKSSAMLDGAVTCPKCHHNFFLDSEISVEEVRKNIDIFKAEIDKKVKEEVVLRTSFEELDGEAADKSETINNIDKVIKLRKNELEKGHAALIQVSREVKNKDLEVYDFKKRLTSHEYEIDRINGKIEVMRSRLFGEITGILEGRVMNGQNFIRQISSTMDFQLGQMSQYQQSKKNILESPETDFAASLNDSLKKYQDEYRKANIRLLEVKSEYDRLREQEVHFTMFKSYIARKKIDALSLIVNDFLGKIGSDIRLRLEGFSVTKSGKLRDKISVMVMRDGIDCGSYHKFSGGEKARLNLACILSLHTLTNSNCEDGKGLDFLIIDELLDKSDEVGMATYCEALNKLGQTALLITQGGVSEGYPHKLLIVKKQGVSSIQT